jgi:hypothetical protein
MINITSRIAMLLLLPTLMLTACEDVETVATSTPAESSPETVETDNPDDTGFYNKNLNEDIIDKDGSLKGEIPTGDDDVYLYITIETSLINIAEKEGSVERVFTNGEPLLTFYHVPSSRGNMEIFKTEGNMKTLELVTTDVSVLNEMKRILLSGEYSLVKIDDTQYGIIIEKNEKSTSYRANIESGIITDVLVETLENSELQQEFHINIQYGLTDADVELLSSNR